MREDQKQWWQVFAPPQTEDEEKAEPCGPIWETPWCVFGQATLPLDDWDAMVDLACLLDPELGRRLQHYSTADTDGDYDAHEISALHAMLEQLAEMLTGLPEPTAARLHGPLHSRSEQSAMCKQVAEVFATSLARGELFTSWCVLE